MAAGGFKRAFVAMVLVESLVAATTVFAAERVTLWGQQPIDVIEVVLVSDTERALLLPNGARIIVPATYIVSVTPRLSTHSPAHTPRLKMPLPAVISTEWRIRPTLPYAPLIEAVAQQHELDPALVAAMIQVESNFDPEAVSPDGAVGLLQLMPRTGERFGLRPEERFDPVRNLSVGAQYMRHLLQLLGDDTRRAVAAFNAGEEAVQRFKGVPPYPETQQYVRRVLARVASMRRTKR